jgi:DNA repair exonuclease SbcCD ATPase subunit
MDATMAEAEQVPQEHRASDSTSSTGELFRYSRWLHVGHGAEECEQREGGCTDAQHFHAWCRLPNQFQHQDIRERALAAKARRIRQLHDPDTDAHVILEADIAELTDRETLVDELVAKDWWKRQLDAMKDVEEREEYEHIEKDRERFTELQALPEDDRPADEYGELERHFQTYSDTVEKVREDLERPIREAAEGMDDNELRSEVRANQIAAEGTSVFMDVYAKWQWFAGTYTSAGIDRKRRFGSLEDLQEAAPEVIEALRSTFGDLETSLQRGAAGN